MFELYKANSVLKGLGDARMNTGSKTDLSKQSGSLLWVMGGGPQVTHSGLVRSDQLQVHLNDPSGLPREQLTLAGPTPRGFLCRID